MEKREPLDRISRVKRNTFEDLHLLKGNLLQHLEMLIADDIMCGALGVDMLEVFNNISALENGLKRIFANLENEHDNK